MNTSESAKDAYIKANEKAMLYGLDLVSDEEAYGMEGIIPTGSVLRKYHDHPEVLTSTTYYSLGLKENKKAAALLVFLSKNGQVGVKQARCFLRKE